MTMDLVSKKNLFLLVVIGDFNAKLSQWHDKDSSTSEGILVESITSQFGLHQIINEPTLILENSSSCIDLIFTSQPNLSVESGTQPSLHPNCHHQIIYAKFNLEVLYPHLTLARFGTIKIHSYSRLILSDDPLMNLTGIELLQINM